MKPIHSPTKIKMQALARKVMRPRLLLLVFLACLVTPVIYFVVHDHVWEYRDRSPRRGAVASAHDALGDGYTTVRYLDQGWSEGESAWFYTVTQGSDLLPYDLLLSLHSATKPNESFLSRENVERWRYLPQIASARNPDGLPVGFARNEYKGRAYLGLTCAACHTGQVNYRGQAMRIDGGPAMADFQTFLLELSSALGAAIKLDTSGRCAGTVCKQLVLRVLARRDYDDELAVTRDLVSAEQRIEADIETNGSADTVKYGYARLDAFGRIYNRVLRGVLRKQDLADLLPEVFEGDELSVVQKALSPVFNGSQKDEIIERALPLLSEKDRALLLERAFNPSSAPVSYPFLWDIPQHDYVQWNGIVANAQFGSVGRNAGEVIGVFGTLEWTSKEGFTLSSLLSGQRLSKQHISYESSIYVHNLRRIEAQLVQLKSPKWPDDVLGSRDPKRAYLGKALFAKHCAGCHAEIDSRASDRRVVGSMTRLADIGTDPSMAENSVNRMGYSGMLRNQYVNVAGVGDVLIDRRAPLAALLTKATRGVIAEPFPNANYLRRGIDWLSDLIDDYVMNQIEPSIKNGHYDPDTTAQPFASLLAYKGRSLNGIWATAPYLHNGSVPTLYDLLLPKRRAGDPDGEDYRPDSFLVGSREFDVDKVGFVSHGYEGFAFDTRQPGNSNAGHEYGTIHDVTLAARHLPPMTKDERLELLEYMKGI